MIYPTIYELLTEANESLGIDDGILVMHNKEWLEYKSEFGAYHQDFINAEEFMNWVYDMRGPITDTKKKLRNIIKEAIAEERYLLSHAQIEKMVDEMMKRGIVPE